jgi:hypothetical protein
MATLCLGGLGNIAPDQFFVTKASAAHSFGVMPITVHGDSTGSPRRFAITQKRRGASLNFPMWPALPVQR